MRKEIRREVEEIEPFDQCEVHAKSEVLSWIDSGAELCRLKKPATPPKHLISYFAVVDDDHLLLVDHINAELWLPAGGHVEPNEHPRETVRREAREELSIEASFLLDGPLFLTITQTVGKTAGHTDVSLWYVLRGDRDKPLTYDRSEFHGARWFHRSEVPLQRSDPQMDRFLTKLYANR
jgi:ADP-ribose pyrophosphatase YjhB (NUDIX family)